MLEDLETQKKREIDFKKMRKFRGELLMNIRAALQNMDEMLICVQSRSVRSKPQKNETEYIEEETKSQEDGDETDDEPQIKKMETNGN